jgi:hypothetical protein
MICPVCEHNQDFGLECEVCGKALGGIDDLGPPPVQLQVIEGLEATLQQSIGEVAVEKMGDLEVTRFNAVNVAPDLTPGMEYTGQAPVGEVAVERVPDLSEDRVPDDGQRTAVSTGPVTCRYCRNVQATGSLCDRCGMKLPVVNVGGDVMVGTIIGAPVDTKVRCRSCGAPARAGERCGDCGRDVPYPDA